MPRKRKKNPAQDKAKIAGVSPYTMLGGVGAFAGYLASPTKPTRLRDAAIGGVLGLLAGGAYATAMSK